MGNPARGSTFATWTVSPLRLASCTRRSRERSHVPEDHPLALRRASPPHDMPQRALVRHGPATAARLPLLSPAQESTVPTCCPRTLHKIEAGSSDRAVVTRERRWLGERVDWAVRRARREPLRGVRERPPVLSTAASRQAKHNPVYPGASTVRGAIGDRLGGAWGLTKDALL